MESSWTIVSLSVASGCADLPSLPSLQPGVYLTDSSASRFPQYTYPQVLRAVPLVCDLGHVSNKVNIYIYIYVKKIRIMSLQPINHTVECKDISHSKSSRYDLILRREPIFENETGLPRCFSMRFLWQGFSLKSFPSIRNSLTGSLYGEIEDMWH